MDDSDDAEPVDDAVDKDALYACSEALVGCRSSSGGGNRPAAATAVADTVDGPCELDVAVVVAVGAEEVAVVVELVVGELRVVVHNVAAAAWAVSSSLMRLETCDLACLRKWSLR